MKSFSLAIALSVLFLSATAPAPADTFLIGSYCASARCPAQPGVVNSPAVLGGFSTTALAAAGAATIPGTATPAFFASQATPFSIQQNALSTGLNFEESITIVPEPATLFLLATGLAASAGIVWWRTRKSNQGASAEPPK